MFEEYRVVNIDATCVAIPRSERPRSNNRHWRQRVRVPVKPSMEDAMKQRALIRALAAAGAIAVSCSCDGAPIR